MNILSFLSYALSNKDKLIEEKEDPDTGVSIKTYEGGERHVCPYYSELSHPDFNDGTPLVVDQYFSEETAIQGHHKLVLIFVLKILNPEYVDVFYNRSIGVKADSRVQSGVCLHRDVQVH